MVFNVAYHSRSSQTDRYNFRAKQQGLTPDKMRAVRADIDSESNELDGQKFDVVVVRVQGRLVDLAHSYVVQCSAAYHHFGDIAKMTNLIAKYIKPGGSLLVADLLKNPNRKWERDLVEKHKDVVAHQDGFTEDEIRTVFEGAGLVDVKFAEAMKMTMFSHEVTAFLAKGSALE